MSSPSVSTAYFSRVRRSLIHLSQPRSSVPFFLFLLFVFSLSLSRLPRTNAAEWMFLRVYVHVARVAFGGKPAIIRRCTRERWYRFVACTRTCAEPPWKDKGTSLSNGTLLFPSAPPSWKKKERKEKNKVAFSGHWTALQENLSSIQRNARDSNRWMHLIHLWNLIFPPKISIQEYHRDPGGNKKERENNWMALEGGTKEVYEIGTWDSIILLGELFLGVISLSSGETNR